MNNDAASHLRVVPGWNQESVVPQLLNIQHSRESKESSSDWSQDLKLLSLKWTEGRLLEYADLDKYQHVDYLALSYTWASSPYEEAAQYNWRIQDGHGRRKANVRDAILDRVNEFMAHAQVKHLWIDNECIDQKNEEEKRRIMGNMHLVYSKSSHPLALFFVPIRTTTELDILERLLRGGMTKPIRSRKRDEGDLDRYALCPSLSSDDVLMILDLIHRLVSDAWWSRAWCYQEEYVSLSRLKFLIPTLFHVRRQSSYAIDVMKGNIAIGAQNFRRRVTQFVFAYIATANRKSADFVADKGLCRQILQRAGWYLSMAVHGHTLELENKGKAMSTQILADISSKGYTVPSDLIHIAANCNLYSFTLNTRKLEERKESLAMSMLTLFFINGEIFRNGIHDDPSPVDSSRLDVFQYLKRIAFDEFSSTGNAGQLACLRRHRLVEPVLTSTGVQCIGNIWKIDCVIRPLAPSWPSQDFTGSQDEDSVRGDQVAAFLRAVQDRLPKPCVELREWIDSFLDNDFDFFSQRRNPRNIDATSLAADNLLNAFSEGKAIGLGHIITHQHRNSGRPIKRGLFALSSRVSKKNPVYAFTAYQEGEEQQAWYEHQPRQEKFVSLVVSFDKRPNPGTVPCLLTEASIHGLFPRDVQQNTVEFPWPRSLFQRGKLSKPSS